MCTSPLYRLKPEQRIVLKLPPDIYKRLGLGAVILGAQAFDALNAVYKLPESAYDQIPCGQCMECRIKQASEWVVRMQAEQEYHDNSLFVTLTYDDDHLKWSDYVDCDGSLVQIPTLCKDDMTKFIKRLRSYNDYFHIPPFRFFYSGEYGERTHRPHFHAIMFGLKTMLIPYFGKTAHGQRVKFDDPRACYYFYRAPILEEKWKCGMVVVGTVSKETIGYVSGYCLKKVKEDKRVKLHELPPVDASFEDLCRFGCLTLPFRNMSRNPGIGRLWWDLHKDKVKVSDRLDGLELRHISYYDRLFDLEDPDEYQVIKLSRRARAKAQKKLAEAQSDLDVRTQEANREERLSKKIKSKRLGRPL